jgi:hypothetical protein
VGRDAHDPNGLVAYDGWFVQRSRIRATESLRTSPQSILCEAMRLGELRAWRPDRLGPCGSGSWITTATGSLISQLSITLPRSDGPIPIWDFLAPWVPSPAICRQVTRWST